jgi:hypothetical protein
MVDVFRILRFATTYEQQTQQQDQSAGLLNYLWDGNPPAGAAPAPGQSAQTPGTQPAGFQAGVLPGAQLGGSYLPQQPVMGGPRDRVIQIARSQVGRGAGEDWKTYLQGTVPYMPGKKVHWCGIFATWVLQQAGITSQKWEYGEGISSILKQTNNPKRGDILYIDQPYQHHGIVDRIEGDTVYSVDGNSKGGMVAENARPLSSITSFYSIGPLLGEQV